MAIQTRREVEPPAQREALSDLRRIIVMETNLVNDTPVPPPDIERVSVTEDAGGEPPS